MIWPAMAKPQKGSNSESLPVLNSDTGLCFSATTLDKVNGTFGPPRQRLIWRVFCSFDPAFIIAFFGRGCRGGGGCWEKGVNYSVLFSARLNLVQNKWNIWTSTLPHFYDGKMSRFCPFALHHYRVRVGLRGFIIIKAGVHVKAVFKSLNTAFLPISRSRFKRR